jgi:hypothetical protein
MTPTIPPTQVGQTPTRPPVQAIGFSGSGFLLVYHLGVLTAFKEHGVIPNVTNQIAGQSGGALIGVLQCISANLTLAKAQLFQFIDICANRPPFYCIGSLLQAVSLALDFIIPKHNSYLHCNHVFTVEVSPIVDLTQSCFDCTPDNVKQVLINQFTSRQDLITVLEASSFVAGVSGTDPCYVELRGNATCDGGYNIPQGVPCPTNITDGCVRVSCHTGPPDGNIYPGMRGNDTLPLAAADWNGLSFNAPQTNQYKEAIYNTGYMDASFWMKTNGFVK